MRKAISFDDVLLVPKYSEITTRQNIDLSSTLEFRDPAADIKLEIPIVSAPMDTVTESAMAFAMHSSGGLGIIHRYNSIKEQANLIHDAHVEGMCYVGAAIGVTGDFEERACALHDAGADVLCVDVAHGHHILMKTALEQLRNIFGDSVHIMAGNVATLAGFNDLADWGADSIRVGVGGGSICSTRIQTGHGVPTMQSVIDCAASDRDALLVADGGIKNSGDIVKALGAGADLVMCGSLLSGTDESPGDVIRPVGGIPKKVYRGMASREAQKSWRGNVGSVEGVSTTVPVKGPVSAVLRDLEWGLRSGLSYSGCSDLKDFHAKADFVIQTQSSMKESNTHILSIV